MPAKRSILHVRSYIEHVNQMCEEMLLRDCKYEGGLRLAPIDVDHLRQLAFISRAILRKHAEKQTRKDIRVETV